MKRCLDLNVVCKVSHTPVVLNKENKVSLKYASNLI